MYTPEREDLPRLGITIRCQDAMTRQGGSHAIKSFFSPTIPFLSLTCLSFPCHTFPCHTFSPFIISEFIHGDKEKGMTHLPSLSCYLDWKVIDVACEWKGRRSQQSKGIEWCGRKRLPPDPGSTVLSSPLSHRLSMDIPFSFFSPLSFFTFINYLSIKAILINTK